MRRGNCFIYALCDPRDWSIRYVGYTQQRLNNRLHGHLADKCINPKTTWIKELKELGLKPGVILLEKVSYQERDRAELEWIHHFITEAAPLTNGKHTPVMIRVRAVLNTA
jgi:hypothetical protein